MRILLELGRTFFPSLLKSDWAGVSLFDKRSNVETEDAQVLRARAKYQTLIEQIPAVTFIASSPLGQGGNEMWVSPQIKTLLGYTEEEWLDSPVLWYQRLHPDDKQRLSKDFSRIISLSEPLRGDYRFIAKDGHTVWVHGEIKIVHDEHGRPAFIHGIGYDITELKRAEEMQREARRAEEQAKRAAEATNREKDQFLAMLSHELRTPLTPVLSGLDVLEGSLSEESRTTLEMMRRNLELEARLINDLLDLTRISTGKLSIEPKSVDAHNAIRQALESCSSQTAHLRVQVIFEASEQTIMADSDRFQQVVRNLLQNAARFTPAGGTVQICTANPEPGVLQIRCRDTGSGIEPGDLGRIFRAFEQSERSVKSGYGGLGLGLAITKGLVEAHGGTITAWSGGRGTGATFQIILKTTAPSTVPRGQDVPTPAEPRNSPASVSSGSNAKSTGLRILLVEDHRDTRQVLERLLTRFGYHVYTAKDVRTARECACASKFDLMISDIGLPDGSGLDLVQAVHRCQAIPAIALSGYGTETDRQQSRQAGYDEHLVKPIDSHRLRETIEHLMVPHDN